VVPPVEEIFRPGTDLRVEFVDAGGTQHVASGAVGALQTDGLLVSLPPGDSPLRRLPVGRRLDLVVRQSPESVVVAQVAIAPGGSPPDSIRTTLPVRVEMTSRRRLYRVDVDIPVRTSRGPGRVLNLSGGGCMLRLDGPPAPHIGDAMDIHLSLGRDTPLLSLRARVVHIHRPDLERPFLGLAFDNRTRKTEDHLVRYVFARQAELLRRGRLWNPAIQGQQRAFPPPPASPPAEDTPD
jgi:hypothetical protein